MCNWHMLQFHGLSPQSKLLSLEYKSTLLLTWSTLTNLGIRLTCALPMKPVYIIYLHKLGYRGKCWGCIRTHHLRDPYASDINRQYLGGTGYKYHEIKHEMCLAEEEYTEIYCKRTLRYLMSEWSNRSSKQRNKLCLLRWAGSLEKSDGVHTSVYVCKPHSCMGVFHLLPNSYMEAMMRCGCCLQWVYIVHAAPLY